MNKITILLPTTHNDGSDLNFEAKSCIERLATMAGGVTAYPKVVGMYRMKSGAMHYDTLIPVIVCVDSHKIGAVKQLCTQFAAELEQESIYCEIDYDIVVEFISAP